MRHYYVKEYQIKNLHYCTSLNRFWQVHLPIVEKKENH